MWDTHTHAHTHILCGPEYTGELYKVNFHSHCIWLASSKFGFSRFLNHNVLKKIGGCQVEFHIKIWILINSWQKYLPLISDELAIYINDYNDLKKDDICYHLSKLSLTFFRLSVVLGNKNHNLFIVLWQNSWWGNKKV